ncbi:MAG: hypothetical protein ABI697_04110 [Devosia sp.]
MIDAEPDSLHRLIKQAMDSGKARTAEEAAALLEGYRLTIAFSGSTDSAAHAALLTTVALASRVFLGGVTVSGDLDVAQQTPLPLPPTLWAAVEALGARAGDLVAGVPTISIGDAGAGARRSPFHVRTAWAGWRGGVLPVDAQDGPDAGPVMALAPMLSAALAVNEAFEFVSTGRGTAGRIPVGLSLWRPDTDWLGDVGGEPVLEYLPSRLWLIGLGHLGQAYLWGLGLLPFPDPGAVDLVLQDDDVITGSSPSTSILSSASMKGQRKTRAMAEWARARGFETHIHERLFDRDYRRQAAEPTVALCGLDNAEGRRALDKVGFGFVVEAGLGRDYRNFHTIRLHTLPGRRTADELWPVRDAVAAPVEHNPAYQELLNSGRLDQCGMTLLAGKAVGAPFVGSVAACLALSEVLRLIAGGPLNDIIDLDLRAIEHIAVVARDRELELVNPGFVTAQHY